MRFVRLLLSHVVVAIVTTRGDGSTTKSELRIRAPGGEREALSFSPRVIQRQGCSSQHQQQHGNININIQTSASPHPHGTLVPHGSPATAAPPSWSLREVEARETAQTRRRIATSSTLDDHLPPPPWVLRGGSMRRDEMRANEEQRRVRNVLLYYPNLIGAVCEDENNSSRRRRSRNMLIFQIFCPGFRYGGCLCRDRCRAVHCHGVMVPFPVLQYVATMAVSGE